MPSDLGEPSASGDSGIEAEIAAGDFVERAAIREPSARERAHRPRWARRRRRPGHSTAAPAQTPFTGPSARPSTGHSTRHSARRRARAAISRFRQHSGGVVTLAAILALGAGLAFVRVHALQAGRPAPVIKAPAAVPPAGRGAVPPAGSPAGSAARSAARSAAGSTAGSRVGSPAASIAHPFAGSPAASFADGAAGIVPPASQAVGEYSAGSVAAAYATVRKLLIAAYLDPQTLAGGSPDAFARLLTGQQRTWFQQNLNSAGLDAHGDPLGSRGDVVSFAPGSTQIVGSVIKVHGTMWAQTASDNGQPVLRIRSSYVIVYPVESPGDPATLIRVVAHNYSKVDFAPWDDPAGPVQPWLGNWPGDGIANAICDTQDGFVRPAFPQRAPSTIAPSGPPRNPYSLASPAPGHGCRRTTGT